MPLNATKFGNNLTHSHKELFIIAEEVYKQAILILNKFNSKKLTLSDLPPHKRITLFFLTRAIKTYSAIYLLCKEGYGQDISNLIRSLLENLISLKYILYDPVSADKKTVRFVEYKWVIFKRCISQEEESAKGISEASLNELIREKSMIIDKVEEFKRKNNISSDKALLTWSGKSIRDMAKAVHRDFVREYDLTFRLSSRFLHAGIIGDREYLQYEKNILSFCPFPSATGILQNLKRSINYLIDFLNIFNALFNLGEEKKMNNLILEFNNLIKTEKYTRDINSEEPALNLDERTSSKTILQFKTAPVPENKPSSEKAPKR